MEAMVQNLKCDLHIHTNFSDGRLSITEVVDLYGKNNFSAIAITDHLCERQNIIGKVSHGLELTLSESNFKEYMINIEQERLRAWEEYEMLVIPGYEITKNSFQNSRSAHLLILGINEFIDPDLPIDDILIQAKEKGAFTVAAHPFHTNEFEFQTFHLWDRRLELKNLVDAWEVNTRDKISPTVLESGLPLIANSDFHFKRHFNSWKTKVYAEKDQTSIFQSIKEQKIDFFLDKLYEEKLSPIPSNISQQLSYIW